MRRRPLCLAAALLLLILWILPKDVWLKKPDIPSGEKVKITGTVTKREQKEDKEVYYLKKCLCDRTDSEISVLAYAKRHFLSSRMRIITLWNNLSVKCSR